MLDESVLENFVGLQGLRRSVEQCESALELLKASGLSVGFGGHRSHCRSAVTTRN